MSSDRGTPAGLAALAFVVAALMLLPAATAGEEMVPEYQLKAEFMERFTRFVDWPAGSSVNDAQTPFSICVIGEDPFGPHLRNLASTHRIKSKPVVVRTAPSDLRPCNMLFIGGVDATELHDVLRKTADQPILTVSDTPGLGQAGVMINFYEDADKVRFEINNHAAEHSGLHITSKLLKLARVVGER